MGWFLSFLYSQLFVTLPKPAKDFTGQAIIVTGSNTGLGLEAARNLSRLNASLIILAVRNPSKGVAAKQNILQSTNRLSSSIEVWELDLQSYESVKAFAVKANQLERFDGALENAGIMTAKFNLVGCFESTITTNVISTFLLALFILLKLKESVSKFNIQPRLTIVSSDLHSSQSSQSSTVKPYSRH
jgi:retinol dehydrogenase 12